MQKQSDLLTPLSNLWAVEEGGGCGMGGGEGPSCAVVGQDASNGAGKEVESQAEMCFPCST